MNQNLPKVCGYRINFRNGEWLFLEQSKAWALMIMLLELKGKSQFVRIEGSLYQTYEIQSITKQKIFEGNVHLFGDPNREWTTKEKQLYLKLERVSGSSKELSL